ncbi:MAG TPA: flagellar motor stator protein MotA [Alphaproteobacteria bacterium]|nr:chemotaxis protein MotA [Alphaproteobacteria bacterium]HEX4891399.1 flagellar motor stator protein MotA [Alphaproteobacteria bacterium]
MLAIGGVVCVFIMVFGGYILAGGNIMPIIHHAPLELMTILGAAVGAFLIGNDMVVVKKTLSGFGKIFKGPKWGGDDYRDLLCLMFLLAKTLKTKGAMVLESHIENPEESAIFSHYPKILEDHFAIEMICDTLRMISMNMDNPHQVEDMLEKQLEKHHHEALGPSHAVQGLADALPALGIVAAVLGIIKTMGSISAPVEVLGEMIGGALTGTFLGVFLAYGFFGPFASRMKAIEDEDFQFYCIIRDMLVAHLQGNAPQVSVEIGRGRVPTYMQPNFLELETALGEIPPEVTA